jgi:hypothetical protein
VTVDQTLGAILLNKVVLRLKSAENAFYKRGVPKLIFFDDFFLERFGWFLTYKIRFESPKLALFDKLSPDGDSKSGNFIWLQLILGKKPCFLGPIQLVTQKVNIHYYLSISE